jgi:hypothetical protein
MRSLTGREGIDRAEKQPRMCRGHLRAAPAALPSKEDKMNIPGFAAEASLGRTVRYQASLSPDPASYGKVLPQLRQNITFVITPNQVCMCYEDTDAQQSVCECG